MIYNNMILKTVLTSIIVMYFSLQNSSCCSNNNINKNITNEICTKEELLVDNKTFISKKRNSDNINSFEENLYETLKRNHINWMNIDTHKYNNKSKQNIENTDKLEITDAFKNLKLDSNIIDLNEDNQEAAPVPKNNNRNKRILNGNNGLPKTKHDNSIV